MQPAKTEIIHLFSRFEPVEHVIGIHKNLAAFQQIKCCIQLRTLELMPILNLKLMSTVSASASRPIHHIETIRTSL